MKKIRVWAFTTILAASLIPTATAQTDSDYPAAARINTLWQTSTVPVCWEQKKQEPEATWVRESVMGSWSKYGAIDFIGWDRCPAVPAKGQGIRIAVQDVNPHVKALGRNLDGLPRGMVLNFTFNNFSETCRFERDRCIRVIAVHEFGHAIGITHEQNRPDAPDWCREQQQGSDGDWLVTQYDPDSVMNYCNPKWSNDGILSAGDIQGVRALYPRYVPTSIDPNRWYRLVTRITDQCIHVQNANGSRRNALWQWECQNTKQFHFRFEPVQGGNYYRIRSKYDRCFHVRNGPTTARRKELWQWECLMDDHFLFTLPQTEDGWHKIKSKSGVCFHVRNGPNRTRREPLWSWECVNQPEFYFRLEPVD